MTRHDGTSSGVHATGSVESFNNNHFVAPHISAYLMIAESFKRGSRSNIRPKNEAAFE